jgi:hypothetical protein
MWRVTRLTNAFSKKVGLLIVVALLVSILLARYTGLGRDWWPRDPFSN